MDFHILGQVRLHSGGRWIALGATKKRGILGILLWKQGDFVSRETIANRLWTHPPADWPGTLQSYISRLRTVLGEVGLTIELGDDAYRLPVAANMVVDLYRFRSLVREARAAVDRNGYEAAAHTYREALRLWHGPLLTDLTTSWAQDQRAAVEEQDHLSAQKGLLGAQFELGIAHVNADKIRSLVDEHPTDEDLANYWMSFMAHHNRHDEIGRYFRAFRALLRREFDAEPTEWLYSRYRALLEHRRSPQRGRTASTPSPDQLPRPTPVFVGRSSTLADLDGFLLGSGGAPVACIGGAPGIGKSTVAIHWADQHRTEFPGGILFADLGGHGPNNPMAPGAVLAKFLNGLGFTTANMPRTDDERTVLLRRALHGRRTLVLLDNVRDAGHVRPILEATTPCPVLITSRSQLTSLDAHLLTLAELGRDESIGLLRRRISRTRVQEDSAALADLADLCAGLPIGLHIASQRIATTQGSVSELVTELREHKVLLDAGGRGDDRDRTLRAVFSWSFEGLPKGAARLFPLLGLFPGTKFSTPAVAALAGLSQHEAERAVTGLLDASLIERHSASRLRVHDLLHVLAQDLIASEPTEVREQAVCRLVEWYLHTMLNAVSMIDPYGDEVPGLPLTTDISPQKFADNDRALSWCADERANILAVSQLAANHHLDEHVWRIIGEFGEFLTRSAGDPRELIEIHRQALVCADRCRSVRGVAELNNSLGWIHLELEEYEQALAYFMVALEGHRDLADINGEAICTMNVGTAQMKLNLAKDALALFNRAIELFTQVGNEVGKAHAHQRIGDTYRRMDWYDEARAHFLIALHTRTELDLTRWQGDTLTALGELALVQEDQMLAIGHLEQALSFHLRSFDEHRAADALYVLSQAYHQIGQHELAVQHAQRAVQKYGATGKIRGEARALHVLGNAQESADNRPAAITHWRRSIELLRELGDPAVAEVEQELAKIDIVESSIPETRAAGVAGVTGEPATPTSSG